jgi:hypothetical protein
VYSPLHQPPRLQKAEAGGASEELGFYIPEDDISHSHRRENLIPYIALTGWVLQQRRNVSCEVRLGFYIPEDDVFHSLRRENLRSYIALTG